MTYNKKNLANNATCGLQFGINEDSMIFFATGNYNRFSTSNFIIEMATFDTAGKVIARENMLITSRSGNQFNIGTRAYEAVPIDDDATSNIEQALPFVATNTIIKQVYSAKFGEDLQDEVIQLREDFGDADLLKLNNCTLQTKSANYTFDGTEKNNTGFATDTTSGNITYTLDLSLFPTTNGLYEFTFCKSTGDTNKVIIDVGTGNTIDNAQTYELTTQWETVTIKITSSTFAKVTATSNKPTPSPVVASTKSTFVAGENITAGNALRNGVIYNNNSNITQASTNIQTTFGRTSYADKVGQTFLTGTDTLLQNIAVRLSKVGSPTGDIIMKIFASDKTTLVGTSTYTLNGSTLLIGETTINFTFNNLVLSGNTTYFFELSRSTASDALNYFTLYNVNTNLYTNGSLFTYLPSTWTDNLCDAKFVITFGNNSEDTTKVYKTDASNSSKINFIGFATNTVSTGGNVIVDTSGVSATQSGLTIGSDYYLSNTAGTISNTPGTNIVIVGKAVSTTGIEIYLDSINQQTLITPTVGASPYTYQNTTGRPVVVSITGGTVSQVAMSRDNTNFYQTARATNTFVYLGINDYVKITYSVVPVLKTFTF